MTPRRALFAALAIPLLVGAGACSEDESLSKDQFIEQGDDLCRRAEDRSEDVQAPQALDDIPAFVEDSRPIFEEAREDFAALEAPEDGQEVQDEFVGQIDAALQALEDLRAAAEDGDEQRVQELGQEFEDQGEETNERLRDYGFEQCGEDDG